ncbi:MAG: 50S ribosomal protein L13 [Phycisphaeraceae bacterium]
MNRQTYHAKNDEVARQWLHVDATDQVLGRLAVQIAQVLMGKHKPQYTPHHDVGDFVIVTHAEKLRLTGRKLDHKVFETYSGYPGGRKTYTYRQMLEKSPEQLVERAVWRMLPKNRLGKAMLSKLKVYRGSEHPHQAQQPEAMKLKSA